MKILIKKIFIINLVLLSVNFNIVFCSELDNRNPENLVAKAEEILDPIKEKLKEKSQDLLVLADMLKTYSQAGQEIWTKNIVNFSEQMPEFITIRLVDGNGKEKIKIINSSSVTDFKDEKAKDYFKSTINSKVGQVYISPILISEISGTAVVRFATKIVNLSGISKAVLEIDWNLEDINKHIKNIRITPHTNIYLINRDGLYLTHSDKNKIMKENFSSSMSTGFENIYKKIRNFDKGWGEYIYNSENFIISYVPFQEMGWILVLTMPKQEYDSIGKLSPQDDPDNNSNTDVLSTNFSGVSIPSSSTSNENSGQNISPTTYKILDGSLRTKSIESYRASLVFNIKMKDNNFYTFKINIEAKDPVKSDLNYFIQQNQNKIINLHLMNENIYKKIKYELVSPAFLQKNKTINQNLVMLHYPLKNEVIRMNRTQLSEYEAIFSEKEKKYLQQYTNMDLKNFANDRFDIKIDEHGVTTYLIEIKLKKTILAENEILKKLKLWIKGDYFLPYKYEWLNEKDETIISIAYENMEVNIPIEDSEFIFNPPNDAIINDYQDIRNNFLEEPKTNKNLSEDSTSIQNLSYTKTKKIFYNEINRNAVNTAEFLAISSLDFIETANYNKLLDYVNVALKNKNIIYIMILANNGEKVIFKSQKEFDGVNLSNPNNLKIKEISHPILLNERIIGSVRIGLALNNIDEILKFDSTK